MLHPWPVVSGYVPETLDGGRGPITSLWSKQFYETDPSRGFVRGYTLQFNRGIGPVNQALAGVASGQPAVGRATITRLSRAARPPGRHRRGLRRPAGGAQPRHARSRC